MEIHVQVLSQCKLIITQNAGYVPLLLHMPYFLALKSSLDFKSVFTATFLDVSDAKVAWYVASIRQLFFPTEAISTRGWSIEYTFFFKGGGGVTN